ncbi:TPA: phage tail family protein, partial [Listeria monocytogenes]
AFDVERKAAGHAQFTLTFEVFKGFSESLCTSLSPFAFSEGIWQAGQGIVSQNYKYKHTSNRFSIYNAGSFDIDPRMHDLRITIKNCRSDGLLTINNKSTGEKFVFNEKIYAYDTIELDGSNILKNGVRCGRKTNLGLISLLSGENEIEIENVSNIETTWDFPFLYK